MIKKERLKRSFILPALLAVVLAGGCATVEKVKKPDFKFLAPSEISSAAVGELFFSYASQAGRADKDTKKIFRISVLRLNDREIILKSVAYEKEGDKGRWRPLPGVKTYTFPLIMKKISIGEYSFNVLSFREGRIRYVRIK